MSKRVKVISISLPAEMDSTLDLVIEKLKEQGEEKINKSKLITLLVSNFLISCYMEHKELLDKNSEKEEN